MVVAASAGAATMKMVVAMPRGRMNRIHVPICLSRVRVVEHVCCLDSFIWDCSFACRTEPERLALLAGFAPGWPPDPYERRRALRDLTEQCGERIGAIV